VPRLASVLGAALAVALAGCGGEDAPSRKPPRPVRLHVASPADTALVDAGTVEVRGTVSPARAQVRVQGRPARVSGGSFSAVVALAPGANVVDVAATARNRAAALTAFRVTREQRVTVPDLTGAGVDDAERALARRGLHLRTKRGGGFLDPLVPHGLAVCEQEPVAGADVRRGTTVRAVVARAC
jgi:Glucodextranase, domain B/PASTA domain